MSAPTSEPSRYDIPAAHGGCGVGQYDFARHGRDVAAARVVSPQTRNRLALLLFAPHNAWQIQNDAGLQNLSCEVLLRPLRLDPSQLNQVAQQLFAPMLGNQLNRLVVYAKNSTTAVLQLAKPLFELNDLAMRRHYAQALRESMSKKDAAVYSTLIGQWLAATAPDRADIERASAVMDPAGCGLTRLQFDQSFMRLRELIGPELNDYRVICGINGNPRLTVTLPSTTVRQLNPTMNTVLSVATNISNGSSRSR